MPQRRISFAEVQSAVEALVGLPFNLSSRAVDMEMFNFGEEKPWIDERGRERLSGDVLLHVQGPWRIVDGDRLVVGYNDMRDPPAGVDRDGWDPNEASNNHRDELIGAYFMDRLTPRIVVAATARPSGDLRIDFDDGTSLEILPMSIAPDDEYWRLFTARPKGPHLVVGSTGATRSAD